jgi:hypothetical protein
LFFRSLNFRCIATIRNFFNTEADAYVFQFRRGDRRRAMVDHGGRVR